MGAQLMKGLDYTQPEIWTSSVLTAPDNPIQRMYLNVEERAAYPFFASKSAMKAVRASMPSGGKAL
jgi:hypothetical protein